MRQQLIEAENSIVKEATLETSSIDIKAADQISETTNQLKNLSDTEIDLQEPQAQEAALTNTLSEKPYSISQAKTKIVKAANTAEPSDKIIVLEQELQDARNKLLVAEAEIERLNNLVSNQKSPQPIAKNDSALVFSTAYGAKESAEEDNYELVVTVVADKTSLRGSPDKSAMRIMELSEGARLKVEDRQGDWFRITTKSGTRAWVSAKDVAFGPTDSASPTNTVRIRPIAVEQSDEEARAFDLIKNHSKK
jgi:hypothetical protein